MGAGMIIRLARAMLPIALLIAIGNLPTNDLRAQDLRRSATPSQTIRLEVFGRGDSKLSDNAKAFAERLANRTPGLEFVFHDVLEDKEQLSRLWSLARKGGRDKPVVPAFYCCGQMLFGFTSEEQNGSSIENLFTVDVYTRSTCSRCASGKRFIESTLKPRWPALKFRIYEITYDAAARNRYMQLSQSRGLVPGLPTFHFAGQVIVGYQGDHATGRQWVNAIEHATRVAPTKSNKSLGHLLPTGETFLGWASLHRGVGLSSTLLAWQDVPGTSDDVTLVQTSSEEQVPVLSESVPPPPEGGASFDDVPFPDELALPEEMALPAESSDSGIVVIDIPNAEPSASDPRSDVIELPFFGELSVGEMGLPLFTFLVGLVDGFNPCAMWILVFLLSVLVNINYRRKILLIAGTFVLVSGLAYYAFMAAWLNVFMLIGFARPAQILLGIMALLIGVINIKDFFAFKRGITLSIPESSKPGLYRRVREIVTAKYLTTALASVVALAVVVNMVELLCTAGLPALYTQILTMQELPAWKNYLYLALYIVAYMLDDTILLTVVLVTLSHRKLQEREGRWLKLISGVVILALGLVMIFQPEWLQLTH